MQFIDINCMIGEWAFKDLHFKSAEELLIEMKRLGIKKSLVFDSRAWQYDPKTGNNMIVEETKGHDELIPVMVLTSLIDQEYGGKEGVYKYIRDNKIGAVRLFPSDQGYTLNPWNIDKLFSALDEAGIPVLLEAREMSGGNRQYYSHLYEISRTYIHTPIILLTVGYRDLRILYSLFEKCPNIYIDTSTFITYRGIEDVVKYYGSERILFGTRMPFIEGGVSVGRVIYSDIEEKDKENIAYKNIERLLSKNKLFRMEEKEGKTI